MKCKMVTKQVALVTLYWVVFVAALAFHKHENLVLLLHGAAFATICALHGKNAWQLAFVASMLGVLMGATEIICVRTFNMWSYNYARFGPIPVWHPVTWAIVSVFFLDTFAWLGVHPETIQQRV